MAETTNHRELGEKVDTSDNLGLFETYGTFPVWMLKAIQLATPSFLVTQSQSQETDDANSSST